MCHGSADIMWGPNRDWARVSGNAYLLQKLKIFFMIPKGELLNEPDVGCCLYRYEFDKLTDSTLVELRMELEYDLKSQLPELGVHQVAAEKLDNGSVKLQIIAQNGVIPLLISRDDLLNVDLLDNFGG
jgi:phage baseplate assembly protein W